MDPRALRELVEARATELGFARFGVAKVEPLGREAEALERWLARGDHASMDWMESTAAARIDPTHEGMLPGARRVMVFVTPYARADAEPRARSAPLGWERDPALPVAREGSWKDPSEGSRARSAPLGWERDPALPVAREGSWKDPSEGSRGPAPGVVARYARGRDYHNVIGKRMHKLAKILKAAGARVRAGVDTLPVLERAWAQRAGVGFIGKNCCLIVPGMGSHVFLSTLITDAELPVDAPMPERCGACRLCLDGCPTRAFVEPRALDSRRCISYLTIEHEGPIAEDLRAPMGAHLFGCDDCQDVCPFNKTAAPSPERTAPFAPDPRLQTPAEALLSMDEPSFRAWAHASPLQRPGREGMARNAAIVLGNAGDRRHLPILQDAAERDESESVRDAAAWAVARIEGRGDPSPPR